MGEEIRTLRMNNELPTLYIPWPACGHCGKDVEIEDGFAYCIGCLVAWDSIAEQEALPDPHRDTQIACEIVVGEQDPPHDDARGRHYVPGPPLPCILPAGHEGRHICPYDVVVSKSEEVAA